ncbi:MAG: undecaprenyl-diphosphate phosphatase [Myxococcales bacterium]|nr:undecaprenyl-diphosphate phosphatase [Myxococcales bacterium]MDD9971417.1 undecaprenyl-diphosphate phosphatase [Myxococcales bacterium]
MEALLQAALLGVVQGLTEFLPVSSSGHLVLAQAAYGESFIFAEQAVAFDLVLHLGTLLPVFWFYRVELGSMVRATLGSSPFAERAGVLSWVRTDPHRYLALLVVLATVPTALMGVLLKDVFERLFHSVTAVCVALLLTGALLFATRFARRADAAEQNLNVRLALLIGVVQGLAITPGISRSGSTIAVALLLGLDRESAARFSFLMSIPAICGAVVLMLRDGIALAETDPLVLATGFGSAMLVGYGALVMLVALVRRGNLHRFTYYLWPAAIVAYLWLG